MYCNRGAVVLLSLFMTRFQSKQYRGTLKYTKYIKAKTDDDTSDPSSVQLEIFCSFPHKIGNSILGNNIYYQLRRKLLTYFQILLKIFCILYPKYVEATLRFE